MKSDNNKVETLETKEVDGIGTNTRSLESFIFYVVGKKIIIEAYDSKEAVKLFKKSKEYKNNLNIKI